MKNSINYLYNLICSKIVKINSKYIIEANNKFYLLNPVCDDILNNIFIYNFLVKTNYKVYKIIYNRNNEIITKINGIDYILIELENIRYLINLSDIINNNVYYGKGKCNWYYLWINKIDYYEYQIEQLKKKYPILYETFSYYSGLTENSISLVRDIDYEIDYYISHKRINKNETNYTFYNITNIVLDAKVRDVCEYFKSCFFNDCIELIIIINYIDYNINSNTDALLFLVRMIYPSYYFDMYDEIISGIQKENKILDICNMSYEYENLLYEIYNYLCLRFKLPEIEWLKKI